MDKIQEKVAFSFHSAIWQDNGSHADLPLKPDKELRE
jgi:hypothetical protein